MKRCNEGPQQILNIYHNYLFLSFFFFKKKVRYDTATVTVSVTDINDRAPVFLNSPYLAYVRENVYKVPATVLVVEAFDADSPSNNNYQLRYLLKDGDKDSFRVNATTGEITVHRALDREKQSEYLLTVIAMDTGEYFKKY